MKPLLRSARRAAPFVLACGLVAASARNAHAAPPTAREPSACMQSAERAQVLRRQGKLAAARAALVVCGADSCPPVVRDDCRTWTAEVQAAQPTVVFSVRGSSGVDLAAATVSVDGEPFLERIDGVARPLDPGPHDIEVRAASETPVRLRIVVHEGEKQRVVPIAFAGSPAIQVAPRTAPAPDAAGAATTERPLTPWVYATGALAVAGVAGFTFLGITALSDHAAMRDGCATTHSCTDDQIASNKARFWMADASLLLGVVAAGVTGYLLYDHARGRAGEVRVTANLVGGPFVALHALF